jgi:chemotaxis protein CheY-P-specific phosphatase CheC
MYFCDAAYCGPASPESPTIGTALTFQGARDGVFRVVVSEARATQMAADFLALDPAEVGPDQIASTVSEFANIACGATMSAWMPFADFHFSVPCEFSSDAMPGEFAHCFSISDGKPEIAVDIVLI